MQGTILPTGSNLGFRVLLENSSTLTLKEPGIELGTLWAPSSVFKDDFSTPEPRRPILNYCPPLPTPSLSPFSSPHSPSSSSQVLSSPPAARRGPRALPSGAVECGRGAVQPALGVLARERPAAHGDFDRDRHVFSLLKKTVGETETDLHLLLFWSFFHTVFQANLADV